MNADPLKGRARRIVRRLAQLHPEAPCALAFADPLQLLVATILSAQCTDALVNKVTPALFARFPDAAAFADAERAELERLLRSVNFFRNKARNVQLCCRQIVEKHGGQVPSGMEELTPLPGVGRKTANVVRCNAFDAPGIPVDTHVGRVSRRMGLSAETNPVKIERDLMGLIPAKEWTMFGRRMIHHGRHVCQARAPRCGDCGLAKLCPRIGV